MNELFSRINELPDEVSDMIIFMAQPRLGADFKRELQLESAFMLCEQHYNWWFPKMTCYWRNNNEEPNYEFPDNYRYGRSMKVYFTKEELQFITEQLASCGCCNRHSQGIQGEPHCTKIRERKSLREIREMKKYYGIIMCTCPCRHILRRILNVNSQLMR